MMPVSNGNVLSDFSANEFVAGGFLGLTGLCVCTNTKQKRGFLHFYWIMYIPIGWVMILLGSDVRLRRLKE